MESVTSRVQRTTVEGKIMESKVHYDSEVGKLTIDPKIAECFHLDTKVKELEKSHNSMSEGKHLIFANCQKSDN